MVVILTYLLGSATFAGTKGSCKRLLLSVPPKSTPVSFLYQHPSSLSPPQALYFSDLRLSFTQISYPGLTIHPALLVYHSLLYWVERPLPWRAILRSQAEKQGELLFPTHRLILDMAGWSLSMRFSQERFDNEISISLNGRLMRILTLLPHKLVLLLISFYHLLHVSGPLCLHSVVGRLQADSEVYWLAKLVQILLASLPNSRVTNKKIV